MSGIHSVIDASKEGLFSAALPDGIAQWSQQLLRAARSAGVNPWVLAGIMHRESSGGSALTPPGPGGTGDFGRRSPGYRYSNGYVVPGSGLPDDGQGWGRGLMQIDYGYHYPWLSQYAWFDPQTNIDYAAGLVRQSQDFFSSPAGGRIQLSQASMNRLGLSSSGPYSDPRPLSGDDLTLAVLAAYNAGNTIVLQALAAGLPASAPTAHNDYASWVMERVVAWASAIS